MVTDGAALLCHDDRVSLRGGQEESDFFARRCCWNGLHELRS